MNHTFLRIRVLARIAGLLVVTLTGLYFGILLHIPLYNAGGFGTDLPQNLLAWIMALIMMAGIWLCVPWKKLRFTSSFFWILAGVMLLTLPVLWAPQIIWLLSRLPSLLGMWGAALLYFTLLQCRFSRKQCRGLLGTTRDYCCVGCSGRGHCSAGYEKYAHG